MSEFRNRIDSATESRIIAFLTPYVERHLKQDDSYVLTGSKIHNLLWWHLDLNKTSRQCLRYKNKTIKQVQQNLEINGYSPDEYIKFNDPQDILNESMKIPLDVIRELRVAVYWYKKNRINNFGFPDAIPRIMNYPLLPTFRWAKWASRFILSLQYETRQQIKPMDTWAIGQMWANRDLNKDEFGSFDDIEAWLAYQPFGVQRSGDVTHANLDQYILDIEAGIIPRLNEGESMRQANRFSKKFKSKTNQTIDPKKFFEWFDCDLYAYVLMNRVSSIEGMHSYYRYLLPSQQEIIYKDYRKSISTNFDDIKPQNILEFFNTEKI